MADEDSDGAAARVAAFSFSLKPVCVQCRSCGHKTAFRGLSREAQILRGDALKRLACSACGARNPEVLRLSDDRQAMRWLADR